MMSMSMEQVHEWAREQQQVGKDSKQVGSVFCQQEEKRDRNKSGKNPSGAAGHAAAVFKVV
jgi:hypothetical protein